MRRVVLPLLAILASPALADNAEGLRPGLWEETTAITGATLAGAPTATPLPRPVTRRMCIAPTLAADPGRWFAEGKAEANCTVSRTKVGSGHVELAGVCAAGGQPQAAVTRSSGSYDDDSYALDVATTMGNDARRVVISSKVVAARVGECAAAG